MLWLLICDRTEELARRILATPDCRLDEWTKRFLQRFNSVAKLLSDDCIAILMALGQMIHFEICAIECRNAQIRRRARNSDTWLADFLQISARWFFMRLRANRMLL